MENLDTKTIVYFLIAIAWFIYSVFKKSQKKAQRPVEPTSPTSHEEEEPTDIKTLLEEILSGKSIKERERETYAKEIIEQDQEIAKKKKIIPKPFYKDTSIKTHPVSIQRVIPTTSMIQAEESIIDMAEENRHEIIADFDLQKALIYSEILKRPQY